MLFEERNAVKFMIMSCSFYKEKNFDAVQWKLHTNKHLLCVNFFLFKKLDYYYYYFTM